MAKRRIRSRTVERPPPLEFAALPLTVIAIGLLIGVAGSAWAATPSGPPTASAGGDETGQSHSHGSAPTAGTVDPLGPAIVTGFGIAVAVFGLQGWLAKRLPYPGGGALLAASSLLLADGVVHLYAVANHVSHLLYLLFFIASGVALLAVAFGILTERLPMVVLAIAGTASLIATYFVFRVVPAPFASGPEPFEVLGILSKGIEFAALVPLYLLFVAVRGGAVGTSREARRTAPRRGARASQRSRTPSGKPG